MQPMHRLGPLSILFFAVLAVGLACPPDEMGRGCRINKGQCQCGVGCRFDFKFSTREECRQALKGRTSDVCSGNPCANGGACTQVSSPYQPFRCRCEGTGYYGPRCQYACPSTGTGAVKVFPYECIII